MIETFQIFAHDIATVPANDLATRDFLTNNVEFRVENRVSNAGLLSPGTALFQMFDGAFGQGPLLLQSEAADGQMFLPTFESSEALEDVWFLNPTQRVSFSIQNLSGSTIGPIQTCCIGHKNIDAGYPGATPLRPMQYNTTPIVIPAGRTNSIEITTDMAYDFLCRAFTALTSGDKYGVAVSIKNKGTGYDYMNTPILLGNFTYNFGDALNFHPRPFSPFIIPYRTTLQITFTELTGNDTTVTLGLWGTHCQRIENK